MLFFSFLSILFAFLHLFVSASKPDDGKLTKSSVEKPLKLYIDTKFKQQPIYLEGTKPFASSLDNHILNSDSSSNIRSLATDEGKNSPELVMTTSSRFSPLLKSQLYRPKTPYTPSSRNPLYEKSPENNTGSDNSGSSSGEENSGRMALGTTSPSSAPELHLFLNANPSSSRTGRMSPSIDLKQVLEQINEFERLEGVYGYIDFTPMAKIALAASKGISLSSSTGLASSDEEEPTSEVEDKEHENKYLKRLLKMIESEAWTKYKQNYCKIASLKDRTHPNIRGAFRLFRTLALENLILEAEKGACSSDEFNSSPKSSDTFPFVHDSTSTFSSSPSPQSPFYPSLLEQLAYKNWTIPLVMAENAFNSFDNLINNPYLPQCSSYVNQAYSQTRKVFLEASLWYNSVSSNPSMNPLTQELTSIRVDHPTYGPLYRLARDYSNSTHVSLYYIKNPMTKDVELKLTPWTDNLSYLTRLVEKSYGKSCHGYYVEADKEKDADDRKRCCGSPYPSIKAIHMIYKLSAIEAKKIIVSSKTPIAALKPRLLRVAQFNEQHKVSDNTESSNQNGKQESS